MGKLAHLIPVVFLLAGPLLPSHLRLTRPDSAVTWRIGQQEAIRWEYGGVTGQVKLTLFKNGARLGSIASNRPIGERAFTWTVGQYGSGLTAEAGNGYQIRVLLQGQEEEFANLSPSFRLDATPPPSPVLNQRVRAELQRPPPAAPTSDIQVVFPNGGETLSEGMEYQIEWSAPDSFGRPRVILMKAGRAVKTVEPGEVFPVKTGGTWKWSWIVGSELARGNDYHLRLEKADRSQGDSSDALFSVMTGEPYLVYVGPRERSLTMGRHTLIRWRAGHLSRPIAIYVFNDQNHGVLIASNISTDRRSFEWQVGELATPVYNFFRTGSAYYFQIVSDLGCSARSPGFNVNIPD